MDKINILLIDDDPSFSIKRDVISLSTGCSSSLVEREVIESNFNLIWLKDIYEIKAYFDGVSRLKNINSKKLMSIGIIPEIIVFDYCLTAGKSFKNNRLDDPSNPNVPLYRVIEKVCKNFRTLDKSLANRPNKEVGRTQKDRYGLIAGTALCSFFSDYISVGLPTTAFTDIANSPNEFGYLEWLHEDQMQFPDSARKSSGLWGGFICQALVNVRDNLKDRIEHNIIKIDLYNIIDIKKNIDKEDIFYCDLNGLFLIYDHFLYGKKIIPISSIYYDVFCDKDGLLICNDDISMLKSNNSSIIIDELSDLISLSLSKNNNQDEYYDFFKLIIKFIESWESGCCLTEPFMTKRGYKQDAKKRLFILAMVICLEKLEKVETKNVFRKQLKEIFFPGSNDTTTMRKTLNNAGINIDRILDGDLNVSEKELIYIHKNNINPWPIWWKIK